MCAITWSLVCERSARIPKYRPQLSPGTVASGSDTWAMVRNIVAGIPGSAKLKSTGAVLMVAHYDSVPSGPGAGDDAASVAAILETIRALKAGPALRNDLIVLFTDGEELGLLGAKAFVETYPAPRHVKVVLNFEFRGDQGPSVLFQTSARDQWLVDQFAAAAPWPRATSAVASVYRRIPSDTDLTIFLDAGMDGLNFAVTGGLTRYHTALDNPDLLDPRSLQHQGSYALSMSRRFGSIELNDPHWGDAVFFVASGVLMHYTSHFALPLALLATLLVARRWELEFASNDSTPLVSPPESALYTVALAIAALEARGTWQLMAALAGYRMLPFGTTYGGAYYSVAALAIIFCTLWTMYVLASRSIRVQNLGAGAIVVWTVLMLAASIGFPGGSYIFTWPLLFATLAISYRLGPDQRAGNDSPRDSRAGRVGAGHCDDGAGFRRFARRNDFLSHALGD